MNLPNLLAQVSAFKPFNPLEHTHQLHTLHLLKSTRRPLFRDQFEPGHITASAFITNPAHTKALFIKHKYIGSWIPPGGHADGEADTFNVALREVLEETGIPAEKFLTNATLFDVDTHPIPENPKKNEPEHLHFDLQYLFELDDDFQLPPSPEGMPMQWFSFEELKETLPVNGARYRALMKLESNWKRG